MLTLLEVETSTFAGFPPQTIHFLDELSHHNTREWFQEHRGDYEAVYMQPAREFVLGMGERLHELGAELHAEPRVHGSILAINRDTRFSRDKAPYKTHLDLWFWHGDGPSRDRPGYFLRLTSAALTLGAGMHAFNDAALAAYREAILAADGDRAERLERVAAQLPLYGEKYKRTPPGVSADHPRARWLRHAGLFAQQEESLPRELFSERCVQACLDRFKRYRELVEWLVEVLPG